MLQDSFYISGDQIGDIIGGFISGGGGGGSTGSHGEFSLPISLECFMQKMAVAYFSLNHFRWRWCQCW